MLKVEVEEITCTALVEPEEHLCKQDFLCMAEQIDSLIKQFGALNGILVQTKAFSGWDGFAAFMTHMKLVYEYQNYLKKIAICTDSSLGNLVEKLAVYFVAAEIKVFPYAELNEAKQWIVL